MLEKEDAIVRNYSTMPDAEVAKLADKESGVVAAAGAAHPEPRVAVNCVSDTGSAPAA